MIHLIAIAVRLLSAALIVGCLAFWCEVPASHAGNLEMVEERTEELGELNQQAIEQIPEELPQDGQLEVTAEVVTEQGETKVKVQDYSITRGKILRNNQNAAGNRGATTKSSIPRYDPLKK